MNEMEQKRLKVSIKTFGCAMNVYDSEVAEGLLEHAGFEVVREEVSGNGEQEMGEDNGQNPKDHRAPFPFSRVPDVILMNTCSVREHAEGRVYGRLGMLGHLKKSNPNLIIGLMGCMVEEHRETLFKKYPQLDLMVGTRNIRELPELIRQVTSHRSQVARIKHEGLSIEYTDQIKRQGKFHAWLPIMTGCNKVCTFCIVPMTRGSEISMPAREVYREASRLVSEGVKWITLLGQNVNSYSGSESTSALDHQCSSKEAAPGALVPWRSGAPEISFPALLDMLCQIDGLERISFTTSHPQDATEELFQVIARHPKISRRFHLPLQSGSDRILKRMKRLHTYEEYKGKIDLMRAIIPGVSITTDIIAGFSGETQDDHEATVRALKEIRYDGAYIYKYSLRPATPAAKLPDDVPLAVKEERNSELLQIQKKINSEKIKEWVGRTVEVFVEGNASKSPGQLQGRSGEEKRVVFSAPSSLLGTFQKIKIMDLRNETLRGKLEEKG